jgi:DNA-binding PadR family transcriptional regulator
MFGAFAEIKEMLFKEIEKFRQHGALGSDKAMTIEELGLSPKFKTFLKRSPSLLSIFVRVDGKYYLKEEQLKRIEEQLSAHPLRQWLRHTASVPKGLLRFYVFKLLKKKPMSGSEIMEEIKKQTDGQWKPSPGSVYPLLTWLRENGYAEELPREVTGIKRYMLTEKGTKFFEKHANFENKLKKKIGSMGPLFFLWMGLHADEMQRFQEPFKQFLSALFDFRVALKENLMEQTSKEVEAFLNDTSEKLEELSKRIERRKQI